MKAKLTPIARSALEVKTRGEKGGKRGHNYGAVNTIAGSDAVGDRFEMSNLHSRFSEWEYVSSSYRY